MTPLSSAAGPPSASGVRRGGDGFQDLLVWGAAVTLIAPDSPFTSLEVESNTAAHVDDLVLRLATGHGGDLYIQVKWATKTALHLDEAFLLSRKSNGRSLLQKLYRSYVQLTADGATPQLRLITNRSLDQTHPLLGYVDGRTDLLVPYAAQAAVGTAGRSALDAWAHHLGATREDLLTMLGHLQFQTGRTVSAERDYTRARMIASGLDDSDAALQQGLSAVASWVVDGRRVVTPADVNDAVDRLGLHRRAPSAILSVQAIDRDPHSAEATASVNWVDLYDGDTPWSRVRPRDPAGWTTMDSDITEVTHGLESLGWHSTLVRGAMRQATFFRVGTALPAVRQHTLRYRQGSQLWSTDTLKAPIPTPTTRREDVSLGPDLAVAIGVAVDPTADVLDHLRITATPVDHLLTITPGSGADDQAVAGAGQAVAFAQTIRDLVRREVGERPDTDHIHLYLAGPGGLALLLGHRWNRVRPTVVYEHLGPGAGYTAAFTVHS